MWVESARQKPVASSGSSKVTNICRAEQEMWLTAFLLMSSLLLVPKKLFYYLLSSNNIIFR